jgi:hypothetical protein
MLWGTLLVAVVGCRRWLPSLVAWRRAPSTATMTPRWPLSCITSPPPYRRPFYPRQSDTIWSRHVYTLSIIYLFFEVLFRGEHACAMCRVPRVVGPTHGTCLEEIAYKPVGCAIFWSFFIVKRLRHAFQRRPWPGSWRHVVGVECRCLGTVWALPPTRFAVAHRILDQSHRA